MKKETEKLAQSAVAVQDNLNRMTVDEINRSAPSAEPAPQEASLEEIAKREGALYIKPKRRLNPPLGSLDNCKNPEKIKREHARAWEYVKGIYENYVVSGEPITFSLCLYPGDADYLWEIPCNRVVYVPRMVAQHLEEVQKYHTFSQLAPNSDPSPLSVGEVEGMRWFRPSGTHYRGKFRPVGAFL